jgi:hypothetical protein
VANRDPAALVGAFRALLFGGAVPDNPGACWVSIKCFNPGPVVAAWIAPALAAAPNLRVYASTAVTGVARDAATGAVTSVSAVQRAPVAGTTGWDRPLSAALPDWYSPDDSAWFTKTALTFDTSSAAVVEATEFGDVLATGGLGYAQGPEAPYENSTGTLNFCGQGTTLPFYVTYGTTLAPPPWWPPGAPGGEPFSLANSSWARIWSYRRIEAASPNASLDVVSPGETSVQNWGGGNDFDTGYLFDAAPPPLPGAAWAGGVNLTALAAAEARAWGWVGYYINASDPRIAPYLTLNASIAGTTTGLAKMPYLRDARRASAGIGGYRMAYADVSTPDPARPGYAVRPADAVALGDYFYADIHKEKAGYCPYPPYLANTTGARPVLPYYIAFRALTVDGAPNVVVAGKAMAETFWANAATRLHPEEWATGAAAGAAAALMAARGWTTADVAANVGVLQAVLTSPAVDAPIVWPAGAGRAAGA